MPEVIANTSLLQYLFQLGLLDNWLFSQTEIPYEAAPIG